MLVTNNINFKGINVSQKVNIPLIETQESTGLSGKSLPYPSSELSKVYFTGNVWKLANDDKRKEINNFADKYMDFLRVAKTDLAAVREVVKRAEQEGFKPWPEDKPEQPIKAGDKFYRVTDGRTVSLIVVGKDPMKTGFKMVGSHCDSPCFNLKADPFQKGSGGFEIAKVMPHGGIKNHQWTERDLALMGDVILKDGTKVIIDIGNDPNDPVIVIPELAPHVDRDHRSQKPGDAFPNENMTPIVALSKDAESKVASTVLDILKSKYGIEKDDLINADLSIVPAEGPRTCGLDGSMISAYGQDDKSSVFCSMSALFDATKKAGDEGPQKTMICSVFSNEEIGSANTYGAKSQDVRDMVSEIVEYTSGSYSDRDVSKAFRNSIVLSADVSTAIDPVRPGAEETTNAAKLGYGPMISKNGKLYSTPEASRKFFDTQGDEINTQTFAFHTDKGGGGTIGAIIATQCNTNVVDTGVPVLGMHAPKELSSKADILEHKLSMLNYYTN